MRKTYVFRTREENEKQRLRKLQYPEVGLQSENPINFNQTKALQ